ncbi:hypothetical protein JXD38_10735 [candidate division WOR-3 bacterium]|nr:hypothetical protein [candidate division WOR-3 bacterium]
MGTPPAASNPARDLLTRNWAKNDAQKLQSILPSKPVEADFRLLDPAHRLGYTEAA